MKVSDIYGGNWLKAEHLQGQEIAVTITAVEIGEIQGKRQIVLSFEGKEKKLGLNVGNANTIAGIYGDEIANWQGKSITLFPTTTQFQGNTTPCIRICEQPPAAIQPQQVQPQVQPQQLQQWQGQQQGPVHF